MMVMMMNMLMMIVVLKVHGGDDDHDEDDDKDEVDEEFCIRSRRCRLVWFLSRQNFFPESIEKPYVFIIFKTARPS